MSNDPVGHKIMELTGGATTASSWAKLRPGDTLQTVAGTTATTAVKYRAHSSATAQSVGSITDSDVYVANAVGEYQFAPSANGGTLDGYVCMGAP